MVSGVSEGFSGFGMVIIKANFQVVGKQDRRNIALKIYVRRIMVFGGRFSTIALFFPPWPGDLFFFSFLITERTSPSDVGEAGNAIGRGDEMNCSTRRR